MSNPTYETLKDYEQANLGPCRHCGGSGLKLNSLYVGNLVRTRRMAKHITIAQLADRIELSAQYIRNLERGCRNWNHYLAEECLKTIDMLEIGWPQSQTRIERHHNDHARSGIVEQADV